MVRPTKNDIYIYIQCITRVQPILGTNLLGDSNSRHPLMRRFVFGQSLNDKSIVSNDLKEPWRTYRLQGDLNSTEASEKAIKIRFEESQNNNDILVKENMKLKQIIRKLRSLDDDRDNSCSILISSVISYQ